MWNQQAYEHYVNATKTAYGVEVRLNASDRKRLDDIVHKKLERHGINPDVYFQRLATGLKWFTKKKQMKYLPVNVVCGEWAFKYYMENFSRSVPNTPTTKEIDDADILQYEMMIINAWIAGVGDTYDDVVAKLSSQLPNWNEVHVPKTVQQQVIKYLQRRYKKPHTTYQEFIGA